MTDRFPKLVALDLDYTLWNLWIEGFGPGPLKRIGNTINEIVDIDDIPISFYPQVPSILHRLNSINVKIAACSRSGATALAREALSLLLMPPSRDDINGKPRSAIEFFDELEIYPGSKIQHFKKIHEKTGIPFSEMLFFDDEPRNKEVEKLGVTFILVDFGLTESLFEVGLNEWRRRNPATEDDKSIDV